GRSRHLPGPADRGHAEGRRARTGLLTERSGALTRTGEGPCVGRGRDRSQTETTRTALSRPTKSSALRVYRGSPCTDATAAIIKFSGLGLRFAASARATRVPY